MDTSMGLFRHVRAGIFGPTSVNNPRAAADQPGTGFNGRKSGSQVLCGGLGCGGQLRADQDTSYHLVTLEINHHLFKRVFR